MVHVTKTALTLNTASLLGFCKIGRTSRIHGCKMVLIFFRTYVYAVPHKKRNMLMHVVDSKHSAHVRTRQKTSPVAVVGDAKKTRRIVFIAAD